MRQRFLITLPVLLLASSCWAGIVLAPSHDWTVPCPRGRIGSAEHKDGERIQAGEGDDIDARRRISQERERPS